MSRRGVAQVAAGILASRLTGLVRERVAAHYLGVSAFGDVFAAVFRGPNVVQNLLGEQALSASFIPLYAQMTAQGRRDDAARFASACFALLVVLAASIALAGVLFAEPIVALLNPGLLQDAAAVEAGDQVIDRYPIAVAGVRIVFPMTALLVVAAWCLGVLNTHGRFFLSYFAPVLWNGSVIAAFAWVGTQAVGAGIAGGRRLVLAACVGALLGAALQLAVQMPAALRLLPTFRPRLSLEEPGVREAVARFGPALLGRGAVQLSGWLDLVLASFLTVGTLAALGWAQRIYLLPVALFGISIAAVELPELARIAAAERAREMPRRLAVAFRRSAFVVAPTVVGFLALGFLIVSLLYRGGSFGRADTWIVYLVLCAYTVGLPATVVSRLLQNVYFAAGDTGTPARVAFGRLAVGAMAGAGAGFALDRVSLALVVPDVGAHALSLAAVGLALGSASAAWFELAMLRRALPRGEGVGEGAAGLFSWRAAAPPVAAAVASAAACGALWWRLDALPALGQAAIILPAYAALYLALGWKRLRRELRPRTR
ncbi:MAG TPA: murein biosynthesis integral membrane protein MurJ [Thermoanaerobaculia bacterium]|nr:murein biosynthesis integral membrane protein MurJ [Thermoanaerobaculia bacterium]